MVEQEGSVDSNPLLASEEEEEDDDPPPLVARPERSEASRPEYLEPEAA